MRDKNIKILKCVFIALILFLSFMQNIAIAQDEVGEWEGVPKESKEEIQSSPQYKALEKAAEIEKEWSLLPEERKTEEAKKKYEEKMKEAYQAMGIDLDKTIENARIKANETAAEINLKSLDVVCKTYKDINGHYPKNLDVLTKDKIPYIHLKLDNGIEQGYSYDYQITSTGYTIIAIPVDEGITGIKKYFIDETGIVRFTDDGSMPSKDSKVIAD